MASHPPLILVVGMHRSGTSLLAGILQRLGVQLPGNLIGGDRHNPEGYYENSEIVSIQERLLIDLERWWPSAQGCLPLPAHWQQHPSAISAATELLDRLMDAQRSIISPYWAIKDPRSSRLLPLWIDIAARLQIPLQMILALRDPAEVVSSLIHRDGPITGMTTTRAQQLWWRFTVEPLRAAGPELPLTLIHYDDWFHQPERNLSRLTDALPLLQPTAEQEQRALALIKPEHRHGGADTAARPRLHSRVQQLHRDLRAESPLPHPPADPPKPFLRGEARPAQPKTLAARPRRWQRWLKAWEHHPAPRFAGEITLCTDAKIEIYGADWNHHQAHLWLQKLPIRQIHDYQINTVASTADTLWLRAKRPDSQDSSGLASILINLAMPARAEARQWLMNLRAAQAIWDPDAARVCLMRAMDLPAYWLEPAAHANAWLAQPTANRPSSWSSQLGLAPPIPGAVLVLGHAGAHWDRALAREMARPQDRSRNDAHAPSIDYRPGWESIITANLEAALAQAGWLAAAAEQARAIAWPMISQRTDLDALAGCKAQRVVMETPITPVKLRGQLAAASQQASAEDRASPSTDLLFDWQLPIPPRAAVLVTLFNYSDHILTALNSVSHQEQAQLELIVVDDASRDDGADRVQAWMQEQLNTAGHPFVRMQLWRHIQNTGLAASRNTAFAKAQADWCFVLDADNALYPRAVQACLGLAEAADPSLAVVHPLLNVDVDEEMLDDDRSLVALSSWQTETLRQGNTVDAMALVRRTAWQAVGGYTHIDCGWEDFDFWCKLIQAGFHGLQCPQILADYRSHGQSMSAMVTNNNWQPLSRTLQERHPWLTLPLAVQPSGSPEERTSQGIKRIVRTPANWSATGIQPMTPRSRDLRRISRKLARTMKRAIKAIIA